MAILLPADFPLNGLIKLIAVAQIQSTDEADEICLKLNIAITAEADQGFLHDINNVSIEEGRLRIIYLNTDLKWIPHLLNASTITNATWLQAEAKNRRPTQ